MSRNYSDLEKTLALKKKKDYFLKIF